MRERRKNRYIIMRYFTARENGVRFRALAGMDVETFDSFLPYFTAAHDEYFRWNMLEGTKRSGTRPYSIQRNIPLPSVGERLYFVLPYLKQNSMQELIAELFGMKQTQFNGCTVSSSRLSGIRGACRRPPTGNCSAY